MKRRLKTIWLVAVLLTLGGASRTDPAQIRVGVKGVVFFIIIHRNPVAL